MIQVAILSIILFVFCIFDDIANVIAKKLQLDVDEKVKK